MGRVLSVEQIMKRDFARADPDETIASARQTMRLGRLRHLLVTRDEVLLGMLSYRELLEQLTGSQASADDLTRITDVMRGALTCIGPEAPLAQAADQMCRYGLGCLPVVNRQGELVGLVTEVDLLRAAYGSRRTS